MPGGGAALPGPHATWGQRVIAALITGAILFGAFMFNSFVTVTTIPLNIVGFVTESGFPPFAVLLLIPSPSDAVTILAMLWVAGGLWWLWRSLGGSRRPTRRR